MAKQVLNKSTPGNRVDHVDQRNKINANFTEIYEGKVDKEAGKSLVSTAEKANWNAKQDHLTLKTVNGESIVGTGNIVISGGGGNVDSVNGVLPDGSKNVALTTNNIPQTSEKQYVSTTEKNQWNGASIGSDLGLLKTTDTPPPTGTHKGDVNSAGTYTNFKDASSVAISFTAPELVDNYGFIYVKDNVATKSLVAKKGGAGKIEAWTAQVYASGVQVFKDGKIYESNSATAATDVPNASTKWVEQLTGYLSKENVDTENLISIVDVNGFVIAYWDSTGEFVSIYRENSIPTDALEKSAALFFKGSEISENENDFINIMADVNGFILGGWKKDGTFYADNIEAKTFKGKNVDGSNEDVTKSTFLAFDFPKSVINLDLAGLDLPRDTSLPRPSVDMIATFRQGDVFLFKAKVKVEIQGHGSAGLPKKGYSLSFYNAEDKKIKIKWGGIPSVDSINVKAFHTDPTHTRDISAGRLWKKIRTARSFPSSFISDFTNINSVNNKDYLYQDDALFYAEGFPMRMTLNGVFEGLYSWRMKKKRENYRMDGANKNNIFLDSAGVPLDWTSFDYARWEVKNPKLPSPYDEKMPIEDAVVLASINRIFNWFGACIAGTTDMRATYTNYINLDSVLDYIIIAETIYHWDGSKNNCELMTWDGLVWSFCPYDMDQTMGVGLGTRTPSTGMAFTDTIWVKFKSVFLVELKARYTFLRDNGILTRDSIYKTYNEIPAIIGADLYVQNLTKWGWRIDNGSYTSIRDIMDFADKRLTYLDAQWKTT